jgi:O-antigen/teichoic acid export membrane protein
LFILKVEYRLITPLSFKKSAALQLFNFSKWQIFGLTAAFLVNWGDNIVLRQYSNLHDIGIYNFAYQIFKGTVTASFIIYSYFLTFITKNIKNKEIIQTYLKKTRPILLFLSIGILGFLFLLIYLLTEKIYGIEYLGVIPLTGILLIATCLAVYSVFYIAIFNALKKYAVVQIILIVQISINLFLDIVFVPRFGIYGAAMATVIGYGFALIMYEYYFQKKISKNLLS